MTQSPLAIAFRSSLRHFGPQLHRISSVPLPLHQRKLKEEGAVYTISLRWPTEVLLQQDSTLRRDRSSLQQHCGSVHALTLAKNKHGPGLRASSVSREEILLETKIEPSARAVLDLVQDGRYRIHFRHRYGSKAQSIHTQLIIDNGEIPARQCSAVQCQSTGTTFKSAN